MERAQEEKKEEQVQEQTLSGILFIF